MELIEKQEAEEKAMRATENQVNKAQRLLEQAEQNNGVGGADRKRSWFQTHQERKKAVGRCCIVCICYPLCSILLCRSIVFFYNTHLQYL